MNRDEIINMPAGREMDVAIAESVFGFDVSRHVWTHTKKDDYGLTNSAYTRRVWLPQDSVPKETIITTYDAVENYSTDIAAAREVMERMQITHRVEIVQLGFPPVRWRVMFFTAYLSEGVEAKAETVQLAICRAALLAMVVEESK